MIDFQQYTFPSGLRLVHLSDKSMVAHFGVVFGTGSRDELPNEHGIAHFIEHMLFKGTTNRKPYHILSRMEDVGGEIDAYTTKEMIVIASSFPKQYFSRAVELVSDITFNSTFPLKEIQKEKEVVFEEINMYKDSPSEFIYDVFDSLLYGDHPMGKNILGTPESISKFDETSLKNFWARQVIPLNTIVCSAGDIPFKKVVALVEKSFCDFKNISSPVKREKPETAPIFAKSVKKNTHQAHCIMGTSAFDVKSKYRVPLKILTNLLGGPGMNSRLNLSLREKYGLVYQVDAYYYPFSDSGNFGVYFGTDSNSVDRCKELVYKEISKLADCKLGTMQLHNAKRQVKGQIILGSENHSSLMLSTAKSVLMFDKIWTIEEILSDVDSVTDSLLLETANRLFENRQLSTLLFY